jgi:DNA-directed RNA polymerase subunit RPC12/RpoP
MSIEEELDAAGREEENRKTNRYRCVHCGAVEVVVTHGEEPSCPHCGNRLVPEP